MIDSNFTGSVFDVHLVDVGESKSDVIKALVHVGSEHPSADIVPTIIKRDLTLIQAEKAKSVLEFTGAKVEIQRRRFVDGIPSEQWHAIRKKEGRKIDPETAEVEFIYAQTLDPYGICPDLPEECRQVGRAFFARNPGSDIWVHFHDLPNATREALDTKRRKVNQEGWDEIEKLSQ